ncbi:hypothetical protein V8D89_000506 [Ganoderma adspersum]
MDLSMGGNTGVAGYPLHGGPNQQWEFIRYGLGSVIRCIWTAADGPALYLTVECGWVRDRAPVVTSLHPVAWNVEQTERGIIISWPNSNYVFDLGDKAAGTPVLLRPLVPDELSQVWRPEEKGRAPACGLPDVAAVPSPCGGMNGLAPGTYYVLLNGRAHTAMDLNGADNTSLTGYPMHGGTNQQWEFTPCGQGYIIHCVNLSADGHGLYLALDCGGLRDYAPVVASTYPVSWTVEQTDEGLIISWPNSQYVFDLANWGDKTPFTKIQLRPLIPGELCQLWRATEVKTACK